MTKHAFVVSGSSDIGTALIEHWLDRGWTVAATYRRRSEAVARMMERGAEMIPLDLNDAAAVLRLAGEIRTRKAPWDILMTCPATMEPIAPFVDCDFAEWERSVSLNFTRQAQLIHAALPFRRGSPDFMPIVILWAGPGTNNAPLNYSAEIVAKIAQIKLCELLDTEISDCRFVIIGPGWVATKTHQETIDAGARAGTNFERTKQKLASRDCTPMERILDFVDWAISQPKQVI
ncbi:MAG: SDR family oxidoreductase, partial [Alphaproteobacteria bacterium]